MYTTHDENLFRIQFHRLEPDPPLHPLLQTMPAVPFESAPVELIETTLTEDEIWNTGHKGSVTYPEKK